MSIEIQAALRSPFSDPDWLGTACLNAAYFFIPVLGPLTLIGWTRHIYLHRRAGGTDLPRVQFVRDLKLGLIMVPANFCLLVYSMLVGAYYWLTSAVVGVVHTRMGDELAMTLHTVFGGLSFLMFIGLMGGLTLVSLEAGRRIFNGEVFTFLKPFSMLGSILRAPMGYLELLLGAVVIYLAASVGILACGLGLLVTQVLGQAALADLLAQWADLVEARSRPTT